MIIMLSYDLNGGERPSAYEDVSDMIQEHATSQIKPLFSQWFIETDDSVQTWHKRMASVADKDDSWFILTVTGPRQGWLTTKTWDWLKERE